MTTFTIETDNNITAFATREEAEATGYQTFETQAQLRTAMKGWTKERVLEVHNSIPGGKPLAKMPKSGVKQVASAIWRGIQSMASAAGRPAPAKKSAKNSAKGAPKAPKATKTAKDTTPAPKRAKGEPKAKADATPREDSKKARVVELLRRPGGATILEIMSTMHWQRHTVRGFMAGAMHKAGHNVESFKPEGGERSYRIA